MFVPRPHPAVTDDTVAVSVTPPPAPSPQPAIPAAPIPFEFTGRAGEYFRIWIVNFFLSIVTLGIYSAWAKVRRLRYFYGHTWVDGSNFEYHGDPKAILRGRLIAVLAFLVYTLLGNFSPRAAAAAALVALPVAPWLLLRSFRFTSVNTSYRNVRFGFDGSYREILVAILPVVIFPLVTVVFGRYDPNGQRQPTTAELTAIFLPAVVFLLAYPWMSGRLHLLRVNGARFGTTRFHCRATVPQFYGLYIIAALLGIVLGIAIFAPVVAIAVMVRGAFLMLALLPLGYLAFFALAFAYTRSRIANLVYNETSLGTEVRLRSRLKARTLAGVYLTNLLAIVASVGLAIPWAVVRTARVRAEALQLEAAGGLEHFVAAEAAQVGATGEEVGALFDFDVAL